MDHKLETRKGFSLVEIPSIHWVVVGGSAGVIGNEASKPSILVFKLCQYQGSKMVQQVKVLSTKRTQV